MLYYTVLCYATLCYAIIYYTMLCYVMLCYAMVYFTILSYAMLCCTILYDISKPEKHNDICKGGILTLDLTAPLIHITKCSGVLYYIYHIKKLVTLFCTMAFPKHSVKNSC